jgi:hypothetical protein
MSRLYVRQLVRTWMADPAMVLPFIDTINAEVTPTAPMWATVSFLPPTTARTSYCGAMVEAGVFDYIALARPGLGDSELLAAAEADVALLMAHMDARLTLLRASGPSDFLQAGSTPYYTVSMAIDYTYSMQPVVALP